MSILKNLRVGVCGVALLTVSSAYAQIQLHSISSRSARDWRSVPTHIDTVLVETHADHGLATTKLTLVLRPGSYQQVVKYDYVEGKSVPVYTTTTKLDSIEITTGFQLPTDFVADSMWLWVDGKPQEGYIQDRSLAAAQYQQIVGTRRDPALLQFSGTGYYNLRIFPTSSDVARKICIQFHHSFDDDTVGITMPGVISSTSPQILPRVGLVTACLPLSFDTLRYYGSYQGMSKAIGYMQAGFSTTDANSYSVSIPGLGTGTFSTGKSLVISGNAVTGLQPGVVGCTDPSGTDKEFLWVGRDKKSSLLTVGFTTDLKESDVIFEAEPQTRIIVLDMRNLYWNWSDYYKLQNQYYGNAYSPSSYYQDFDVWQRAQKLAILSLQNYVGPNHKFNVLIAGATVQSVFGSPVAGSTENIAKSIKAIIDARPSSQASTVEVMRAAAASAQNGIVVLISDLIQPYDFYSVKGYPDTTANGRSFDAQMDSVEAISRRASLTLFTVDDNYRLNQISVETGGYRLAGVLNSYNVPYKYVITDGRRVQVPLMPSLFGSSNQSGVRDLRVAAEGLDDLVFTNDSRNNYYWWDMPMLAVTSDALAKRSASTLMVLPTYNVNTALIRASGRVAIDKFRNALDIQISGKMGGLRFTRTAQGMTPYTPALSSTRPQEDVAWAFRATEALAAADFTRNAAAIKAIGKTYHIVTRQTSLLALEPGMKLWEDTLKQQSSSDPAPGATLVARESTDKLSLTTDGAPTTTQGSGIGLDGISLNEIAMQSGVAVIQGDIGRAAQMVRASTKGRMLTVTLGAMAREDLTLKLYDLRGRLVFSRGIDASRLTTNSVTIDLAKENFAAGSGSYTLVVKNGTTEQRVRVSLVNR